MAKKALYLLLVSSFVVVLAGPAVAEPPVSPAEDTGMYSSGNDVSSPADPEKDLASPDGGWSKGVLPGTWQEREEVETGAVPAMPGSSPEERCCTDNGGVKVDENGVAIIRPGIDDGP